MEEAEKTAKKTEQERYGIGVAEIEENLRAQVFRVCKGYCLQVWNEALNQAGVDASSTLRRAKNVFYPPAIQASSPSSSKAKSAPKDTDLRKNASASTLPPSTIPPNEVDQVGAIEKEKDTAIEVALKPTKLPTLPKETSEEKGVSQSQELVLVTLPFTTKEDPKGKGTTQAVMPEVPTKVVAKTNPPSFKIK